MPPGPDAQHAADPPAHKTAEDSPDDVHIVESDAGGEAKMAVEKWGCFISVKISGFHFSGREKPETQVSKIAKRPAHRFLGHMAGLPRQ
jgi:hypothetical protein